jgi:CheY-like chemotaxis protein
VAVAVGEVVSLLRPLASEKGLLINVESVSGLDAVSDRPKLFHILQNLVGNAIKFTPAGSITLTVARQAETFTIAVRDTGIGIPPDQLDRIFEEFRQADASMSRQHGGSGLGLAIARKYAILLGGSLTVASTVGAGSTFELRLPLRLADPAPPVAPTEYFGPTPQRGNRVLLIEDNEAAIIQIRDLLAPPAFSLRVARDGAQGLLAVAAELPDAIVLDLNMPGVDGFAVLKALREAPGTARTPVLILTARHVSREELSFLKENGIYQLIQKGAVQREALLETIRRMLGQPDPGVLT